MGKRSAAGELFLGNMGSRIRTGASCRRACAPRRSVGAGVPVLKILGEVARHVSGAMARSRTSRNHS
jgi:hypothetical protein